ncbi:MAG: biopolymer transporter ExbD [Phycisphaerales bacterium]
MRLARRRKHRLEVEDLRLPLIALIDVVLFLLFYFIIAGTMAGVESELPSALGTSRGGSGQSSSLQPQVLSIVWVTGTDSHAEYKMGQRTMRERRTLQNVLGALPKDVGIIIRPSPDVPVEATAAAIQAARDAGFRRISYAPSGS